MKTSENKLFPVSLFHSGNSNDSRMLVVFEELQDLHGVWSELSSVWNQIDELREKPWLSIHPRKLRQQLDALTTKLKELPSRLRQYASYDHVKQLLQNYTKVNFSLSSYEKIEN